MYSNNVWHDSLVLIPYCNIALLIFFTALINAMKGFAVIDVILCDSIIISVKLS